MNKRNFLQLSSIVPEDLTFSMGTDKHGKPSISMHLGPNASEVAFVSPACVTHWPRCTGDGNFGTMWGPTDISKAKFSLDLTDAVINDQPNDGFECMSKTLEAVDEKLLDFIGDAEVQSWIAHLSL